ncbi:Domain of uncharacterised function (DUF477) [Candidatus Ornithobacterium hominis]|nr:Domain of uncharacterised function (DUF477) [Candidatus Ornithobacterium hominis]
MIEMSYPMKSAMANKILSLFVFIFSSISLWGQYDIPEKPTSDQSLIFDYSESVLLNSEEKQRLNQKLIDYERETSTQIIIVLIKSLQGEDENQLAANWAHKWGIGQKGKDNGLIILVSQQERRISIQNGYGLEEFMTDAMSRRIIYNYIIPEFKQGNYYAGLDKGTEAIINILEGKFVEEGNGSPQNEDGFNSIIIILFIILFLYFIFRNHRGGGGNGKKRSSRDVIFTDFGRSVWIPRTGGFGSSRGGSFGGGGFGGFGGGGFGGGGASGGW